jgi:hypothetical protein
VADKTYRYKLVPICDHQFNATDGPLVWTDTAVTSDVTIDENDKPMLDALLRDRGWEFDQEV